MTSKSASVRRIGPFSAQAVTEAALELRNSMGSPSALAFAFVSPDYQSHLEEFCEIVRVDGHVTNVVGSTGVGIIIDGVEEEDAPGFSLLALNDSKAAPVVVTLHQRLIEDGVESWAQYSGAKDVSAWVALANPFVFDVESWLTEWNRDYPGVPCVGGLASSGSEETEGAGVFVNGQLVDALAVAFGGDLRVVPVVSQGCRPIGEPLTVTKAESNVVYSLGSQPAYEALESAFEALTDGEKATAKGNLFAGLAGTEYVEDFKPGDFLIRNILGADPDTGAVVIGGIPRVGQTLQYQLRDRTSADSELRAVLRHAALEGSHPVASLLFACNGRGARFFGNKSHDASLLEEILGQHHSAGFFCSGEIGPIGGKNCIHSYTASCALIVSGEQTTKA